MAETTRPALEVLHEVVDAWLRRNERRAATEAAFPDAGPMVRIRFPPAGSLTRTCSSRRNSTGRSIPCLGEPGDRRIAIGSRSVMRVLKERTFAHTTPHPIGAHRLSITQSNLRDWFFRPPVIPRADLTGYRLDKGG